MIASLPMYDLPEIRDATDAFWAALSRVYGAKVTLTRQPDWKAAWRQPDLLFSQTCGYPFTHEFKGQLTYVATPHYTADGCDGPHYSSILFARTPADLQSLRENVAAYNSTDSMSGFLALRLAFAETQQRFENGIETGSHVASLLSVQRGEADVCAVDCVTIALLRQYRPAALEGLIEIARSPLVPALPFVTRAGDAERLAIALKAVCDDPVMLPICQTLLLQKISVLPPDAYDVIPRLERELGSAT